MLFGSLFMLLAGAAYAQSMGGMSGINSTLAASKGGAGGGGAACSAIQADFSDATGCNTALLAAMIVGL